MAGIVFKQRFNPVSNSKTAGLNVRHLQYIATRPGAVYNRGCGFSLWGRLPGERQPQDIQSLDAAKDLVREVSQRRTVYKAVISVGAKDALAQNLYDRANWERLARAHMGVIARQMGIADKDFCYLISMHQAKGHPHIHILYWDNGTEPRQEFLPRERFERIAEAVRADWNRDILADEIAASRTEQQESSNALRTTLMAMCLEANPARALDLSRLTTSPHLEGLSAQLWQLVQALPERGSLKYKYLPAEYKQQLDAFLDHVLTMPELAGTLRQYLDATDALSDSYGNGEETTAKNRARAVQKLYTSLGNGVMEAIRDIRQELEASPPETMPELLALAYESATLLRSQPSYAEALSAMPRERVPTAQLYQLPAFRQNLNALVVGVLRDPVLKGQMKGFIRQAAADAVEPKEAAKEIRRAVQGVLRREAVEALRQDAGYNAEQRRTATAGVVQAIFRLLSQMTSQRQAQSRQHDLHRKTLLQKSREERKHTRAKMQQRGRWSQDADEFEP